MKLQTESDFIVVRLRKNHVATVLLAVIFFLLGYLARGFVDIGSLDLLSPAQQVTGSSTDLQSESIAVDVDDDPFLGPEDAAVTIVEFSDYECPFCKRFRDETLDQILETYEGQVRLVYRDFPLSNIHPTAQKAAEAAECAKEQGQYWPMHDRLFAAQTRWAQAADASALFNNYAAELNLDTDQFRECLEGGKYAAEVLEDFNDGVLYGVTGTPAFFINGIRLIGAHPFSSFQEIIDRELAGAED